MNKIKVDEAILVSAVRYALGRRTYIVGLTCDEYKSHIAELTTNTLAVTFNDIHNQIDWHGTESLGDNCDAKKWVELLNIIKTELYKRDYKFSGLTPQ